MKKIFLVLIIIIMIGVGIFIFKDKFSKSEEISNKEEVINNKHKYCLIIDNKEIECNDNIIYNISLENDINELLKIEYKGEFIKDNFIKIKKVKEKDFVFFNDGIFKKYYDKASNMLKTMSLEEKVGQVFLARTSDVNQIKDLKKYQFGGYLLFKRDFQNKTKKDVIDMIKSYQDNANIPLLIAADEEGGIVSRISSNKNLVSEPFKSPRVLYKEGGLDKIKEDTISKNKILDELGINLNLAPVVDIATHESDYMYKRSLGENEEITSEFAKTVIMESKNSKVSYCLKHFPGYGNNSDTHIGLSYDTRSLENIKEVDLKPFLAGIESGAESVLVSHNIVSSIDNDNPASLSNRVHNLLHDDLKFSGVIITDDLSMDAIDKHYKEGAVVKSVMSGNDLLIVTDYKRSIEELIDAINNKSISINVLNKRVLKILAWKYYKGLI